MAGVSSATDNLSIAKQLPNGARVLRDSSTGIEWTSCPFEYRAGDCNKSRNRSGASTCPDDNEKCIKYIELTERGTR